LFEFLRRKIWKKNIKSPFLRVLNKNFKNETNSTDFRHELALSGLTLVCLRVKKNIDLKDGPLLSFGNRVKNVEMQIQ
jgi:hypothetical protein